MTAGRDEGVDALRLHGLADASTELLGAALQPVVSAEAKTDPRDWFPGERSVSESIPIPAMLGPGEYVLALALVDSSAPRRPWRLAFDAPEHEGRYEISKVKVE